MINQYLNIRADEDFSDYDNALNLINKIRDGEISLKLQTKLKSNKGEIKRVQEKRLLKESKEARTNIENLYNARKAAIAFLMNIVQEHLKLDVK